MRLCDRFLLRADEVPSEAAAWRPDLDVTGVEAIIPAAGRGTRLAFDQPKILFPVDGHTILEHLATRLAGLVRGMTLVLSSDGLRAYHASGVSGVDLPVRPVVQREPTGMADAVLTALEHGVPDSAVLVVIVWGDQIGLRRQTIARTLYIHQHHPRRPALTFPVVEVAAPYVHYGLDARQRVVAVRQKREGEAMPPRGLADCGCFVADRARLSSTLRALRAAGRLTGRLTGEMNFLPVVAALGTSDKAVAVQCASVEDTIGINTREDAIKLEGQVADRP